MNRQLPKTLPQHPIRILHAAGPISRPTVHTAAQTTILSYSRHTEALAPDIVFMCSTAASPPHLRRQSNHSSDSGRARYALCRRLLPAYASIHRDYMSGRVTLIGCPKLDGVDYTARLTEIMSQNRIRSVTVLRMEVPCCGGLEAAAWEAVRSSGHDIPYSVVTVSVDGKTV